MSEKPIYFIYCAATGEITARQIIDTTEDGVFLQGFCLDRQALRTFRKDRILERLEDSAEFGERLAHHRAQAPRRTEISTPRNAPIPYRPGVAEICFTGFTKALKEELTALALGRGLVVRSAVTQHLTFLCCGPNAGPSKQTKARRQGVHLVSESQLRQLLDFGELDED